MVDASDYAAWLDNALFDAMALLRQGGGLEENLRARAEMDELIKTVGDLWTKLKQSYPDKIA